MKKLIVSFIAFFALTAAVSAQENAIGLRFGAMKGFGMELSYQRFFGDINRVELDAGLRFYAHHTAVTGALSYQWHWFLTGGLGVYGGPAVMAAWTLHHEEDHRFNLGLGGQVGFDYQFDAPVQLSLDFRPTYCFFGGILHGFDPYVGLGLRYAF